MIYTNKIQKAIHFSIEVHELNRQTRQLRKGKKVAYITHPLAVGLILSLTGASEEVMIAGILHDTIEDCEPHGSVTKEMIEEKFGQKVADLVYAVTEKDKELPWHERKELALEEIQSFSHEVLLVKSADIISNNTELIGDYEADGEKTFLRFNAPKEIALGHTLQVIGTILTAWEENPLADDLISIAAKLQMMAGVHFMKTAPAPIITMREYSANMEISCPVCGWKGTPEGNVETYDVLMDVDCPWCDKKVLIVEYPMA